MDSVNKTNLGAWSKNGPKTIIFWHTYIQTLKQIYLSWQTKKFILNKIELKFLSAKAQYFNLLLELVSCKKQQKKFLTSYWFAE